MSCESQAVDRVPAMIQLQQCRLGLGPRTEGNHTGLGREGGRESGEGGREAVVSSPLL